MDKNSIALAKYSVPRPTSYWTDLLRLAKEEVNNAPNRYTNLHLDLPGFEDRVGCSIRAEKTGLFLNEGASTIQERPILEASLRIHDEDRAWHFELGPRTYFSGFNGIFEITHDPLIATGSIAYAAHPAHYMSARFDQEGNLSPTVFLHTTNGYGARSSISDDPGKRLQYVEGRDTVLKVLQKGANCYHYILKQLGVESIQL